MSLFIFFVLFFSKTTLSQNNVNIDSLQELTQIRQDDSLKITHYYALSLEYRKIDKDTMRFFAEKALSLSQKLEIKTEIAKSYHILGIFFAEKGDLQRALDYFFNSLKVLETIGDESRKGVALGAIARVSQMLENHEQALKYDLQALEIAQKNNDTINLSTNFSNVGADYSNLHKYQKAIEYYEKALEIAAKNQNIRIQALCYLNLGFTNSKIENTELAFSNLRKAENLYLQTTDKYGLANTYNKLAEYFLNQDIPDSTIFYAKNALDIGLNLNSIAINRQAFALLSEANSEKHNFEKAFDYLQEFNKLNDSIINTGNTKKITRLEMKYEFEKEREIAEIKHKAEVRKQEYFTIFSLIAFFLTLLLGVLIFRSYIVKRRSEEKLAKLNAVKDRFFRIISHDLKSPFMAFISISEILAMPNVNLTPEKVQYFATSINKTAKSSYDLFQNLLLWSMSQRGNLKIEKKKINLKKLVADTVNLLNLSAEEKNILISTDISENCEVFSDENILKTVIRNILSNAIKFTPKDGKIQILAKKNQNFMQISIKDTGVGISEENISKIFSPNEHLSKQGTNNEKGTGLGLILCKELIEKANGQIAVKSRVGEGSEFIINL